MSTAGRACFQGLQASLLGTAVSQGVYFYLYSLLRQSFVARHQRLTSSRSQVPPEQGVAMPLSCTGGCKPIMNPVSLCSQDIGVGPSLLVAFLAGCGNVLITNPIWTIATRMQACTLPH